jgi:hypothetical protein
LDATIRQLRYGAGICPDGPDLDTATLPASASPAFKRLAIPVSRRFRSEDLAAHVVVDTND